MSEQPQLFECWLNETDASHFFADDEQHEVRIDYDPQPVNPHEFVVLEQDGKEICLSRDQAQRLLDYLDARRNPKVIE